MVQVCTKICVTNGMNPKTYETYRRGGGKEVVAD